MESKPAQILKSSVWKIWFTILAKSEVTTITLPTAERIGLFNPTVIRKSYGKETTLKADIDDTNQMMDILDEIARRVIEGLRREDRQGLTLTLKVKYHDFQSVTRSVTFSEPICDIDVIMENVKILLANTEAGNKKVRLLGISVSNFLGVQKETDGWVQLPLPFGVKA